MSPVIAPWRPRPKPATSVVRKATSCVSPKPPCSVPLASSVIFRSPEIAPRQKPPVVVVVVAFRAEEPRVPNAIDVAKLGILRVRALMPEAPVEAEEEAEVTVEEEEDTVEVAVVDLAIQRLGKDT